MKEVENNNLVDLKLAETQKYVDLYNSLETDKERLRFTIELSNYLYLLELLGYNVDEKYTDCLQLLQDNLLNNSLSKCKQEKSIKDYADISRELSKIEYEIVEDVIGSEKEAVNYLPKDTKNADKIAKSLAIKAVHGCKLSNINRYRNNYLYDKLSD
nr:hypothetical protein [Lachnospiraceae bacterium]